MNVLVVGAGVQGTIYGVRLAQAGHDVTLVARSRRAATLRASGAVIEHAVTGLREAVPLSVVERVEPACSAEVCLVTVRREQIEPVLADLHRAVRIRRVVIMVNHANGSQALLDAVGKDRLVLGFPGFGGGIDGDRVQYVDIPQQPTTIQSSADDVASMFRGAGLRTASVPDMDAWLRRHAVFVTAIAGALYERGGNAQELARDADLVRSCILSVREGWAVLDRLRVRPAPLALRSILSWVPLPFAVRYWCRLLGSPQGEYFFARHSRRAIPEMAALTQDVREMIGAASVPHLARLYAAIDEAVAARSTQGEGA